MRDRRRRVVITGLGVVAPNGIGKNAFWDNLLAGKSAVDFVSAFDPSDYPCKVAAEIKDFRPSDFMRARTAKMLGRFSQLAVAAGRLALDDAGLGERLVQKRERAGVCFGTAAGGTGDPGERNHRKFLHSGYRNVNPLTMLEFPAHAATCHTASELSILGASTSIAAGCTTGIDTVLWGTLEIQRSALDIALVGASDAPLSEFVFAAFCAGNFLATWNGPPSQASRPYDFLRSGLVLSEASAALVLEERDHALDRGARIYAEILGAGSATESNLNGDICERYRQGLRQAIQVALNSASISAGSLDHINAHGNSTKNDDAAETRAYKDVLGAHAYAIPITSIKGAVGQPLAAGGVLQIAAASLAATTHYVPPTINHTHRDPECDLDYVPNEPRCVRLRYALVHSHSLGGIVPGSHAALILGEALP